MLKRTDSSDLSSLEQRLRKSWVEQEVPDLTAFPINRAKGLEHEGADVGDRLQLIEAKVDLLLAKSLTTPDPTAF